MLQTFATPKPRITTRPKLHLPPRLSNNFTSPIADPAANPPTIIICKPPLVPSHTFLDPLQPETKHVLPYPNPNKLAAITPSDHQSATITCSLPTKKYGSNGMNPPRKYPQAIVRAHVIAREASCSGCACWKCIKNCTTWGDFARWKVKSSVRL
ncbi:hypothetical protein KC316_g50 [Hortaea werneckii]|nr:hypothetical protein KC316_g50 [Hortaea werneckii]